MNTNIEAPLLTVETSKGFSEEEWDGIGFHLVFALIGFVLFFFHEGPVGMLAFAYLAAYNVSTAVFALRRGHRYWMQIWSYVLPLSGMLLVSTLFLVNEFSSLVFSDTQFPEVGRVPLFMALAWTMPLFLIVSTGRWIGYYQSDMATHLWVGVVSALVFAVIAVIFSHLPIWSAQDVLMAGPVAAYSLCAQVVLGVAAYAGWNLTRKAGFFYRAGSLLSVVLAYLGALALFYFLFERALVSGVA